MMKKETIAEFTVRITSAENVTWQGEVEAAGEQYIFQSEIQLLKWLCKKYPRLMPELEQGKE